ncbi:hypothetical protein PG996_010912 [Apiospora saccharicola]|uniref:Cytochrome P450 n=1 Tax=Apiospora saccharicola TaxID=335842 RepID=A0ABR1UQL0_9PEZI
MDSTLALLLGLLGTTYVFLRALIYFTQHPKEPPVVKAGIPFLGPLIGLLRGGPPFFAKLRDKHNLPIYTLRMPGQRIYVVNSLSLIPLVQRQIKTHIAFAPIEAQAAATVMGVGPGGNAIIGSEHMLESDSYLSTFVPSLQPALAPGAGLDALSGAAIRCISESLAKLAAKEKPTTVELFAWVRSEVFLATTQSIYGPLNPFRDPKIEQAWYDFEPGIMVHMLQAWPSLLAPKSLHARDQLLIPAFEKYFAANGHLQGSLLVQCRYQHNTGHGLRGRDVAATEVGQMVASVTNSVSSAFWMVYHLFSDPAVLEECRDEVAQLVRIDDNDGSRSIDLAKVKSSCPVLLSTWQETLRYVHINIAARVVMNDTTLEDGKWLLKKGSTVMTVATVQHTDPSVWGPTVRQFDHRRFFRVPGEKKKQRINPVAIRSFGGGTVLCPGRHFVSNEVMALATLLLLRFNLKPLSRSKNGEWPDPGKNFPMTSSMPTPRAALNVDIILRDSREWRVEYSAANKGVVDVAEDVLRP